MRDDIVESADAPQVRAPLSARRLISAWSGTAVAAAAAVGLAWWAYGLGMRDPGTVPIVLAAGGPVKERSEPGATPIPNSDIESYGLASEATLVLDGGLAPETAEPRDEDLPLGALATMAARLPRDRAAAPDAAVPPERPGQDGEAEETGAAAEPGAPDGTELAAIDPEATVTDAGPVPAAGVGSKLAPAAVPLAPRRPTDLPRRVASARAEAAAEADTLSRRAAASPFQLQLGAYLSEDLTRAEWARISRAHAELLNNRALAIQTTLSGGKTYYRLRVGPFEGLAEAASVCEALRARGQDCIPAGNQ